LEEVEVLVVEVAVEVVLVEEEEESKQARKKEEARTESRRRRKKDGTRVSGKYLSDFVPVLVVNVDLSGEEVPLDLEVGLVVVVVEEDLQVSPELQQRALPHRQDQVLRLEVAAPCNLPSLVDRQQLRRNEGRNQERHGDKSTSSSSSSSAAKE
jgi:hypothetical protein